MLMCFLKQDWLDLGDDHDLLLLDESPEGLRRFFEVSDNSELVAESADKVDRDSFCLVDTQTKDSTQEVEATKTSPTDTVKAADLQNELEVEDVTSTPVEEDVEPQKDTQQMSDQPEKSDQPQVEAVKTRPAEEVVEPEKNSQEKKIQPEQVVSASENKNGDAVAQPVSQHEGNKARPSGDKTETQGQDTTLSKQKEVSTKEKLMNFWFPELSVKG
jgi:outer membrane biosynthesis protein TonB